MTRPVTTLRTTAPTHGTARHPARCGTASGEVGTPDLGACLGDPLQLSSDVTQNRETSPFRRHHPPVIGPHASADRAVVIIGFADRGSAVCVFMPRYRIRSQSRLFHTRPSPCRVRERIAKAASASLSVSIHSGNRVAGKWHTL